MTEERRLKNDEKIVGKSRHGISAGGRCVSNATTGGWKIESCGSGYRYDNPEEDIDFLISGEEALKDFEFPILKRPFNRTELMRNLSPENRISGIIEVDLSEIIRYDLDHFLDLIEERLGVDGFCVSGISYRIVGHRDNVVFLLLEATSEDIRLKFY